MILCVDDDRTLLTAIGDQIIDHVGIDVECAESANEAIDVLITEHKNIDFIISDQKMPGMKGHEFLLYCSRMYPKIPSILLTGYIDIESVRIAKERMPDIVLFDKPWDIDLFHYIKMTLRDTKKVSELAA